MIHQKGCFTIQGINRASLDKIPEVYNYLKRIEIPKESKDKLLKQLNQLFINDYSVYPDFQGMSEVIKRHKSLFNV